jgi:Cu(I)/Ag(I) efflux system periplasmic protein CusF
MKISKPSSCAVALVTLLVSSAAWAQLTPGEVRKVDKETGRVTLKHAEIKQHDMAAMTMIFRVKEPAMLAQLKEGERILFETQKIGGYWTLTVIKPVEGATDTAEKK